MNGTEYVVSHGSAGDFGRFAAAGPLACERGDRVVVRTRRGLEVGAVLCAATPQHATHLPETAGELLRRVTPEDEQIAAGVRAREQQLFTDARQLAAELALPLEVLDVETTLDGHQVTLFFLRWAEADERPLVSALSKKYEAMVALRDLALPAGASGCGKPGCGSGGCGSGGCGSCGKGNSTDVQEYFAGLRQQLERRQRVPLA